MITTTVTEIDIASADQQAERGGSDHRTRLDLSGKHVMLDGYNLQLSQGTGIKRYAEDVLHEIREAGGQTGVLFSCGISDEPAVQSALMYEPQPSLQGPFSHLRIAPRLLWSAFGGIRAKRITPSSFSLPADNRGELWHQIDDCVTLPNVFSAAHQVCKITGRAMKLRIPEPIDLVHMTVPLPIHITNAPMVTTVHDLIPLRMPWSCKDHKRLFYSTIKLACERSDAVICISEATKRDLLELFDVDESKIHLTFEPVPSGLPVLDSTTVDQRLKAFGLERDNYLLFVGAAADPKKNLKRLIQALTALDRDIPIVIVGPQPDVPLERHLRAGQALARNGRLQVLGYVPSDDLSCLYQGCRAFLFPSLYEGFGLPPLEAIRFGRPVLASNRASLPEVCGGAALYVDPMDVDDIAKKAAILIDDASVRGELMAQTQKQVDRFSQQNYQQKLGEAYRAAMQS